MSMVFVFLFAILIILIIVFFAIVGISKKDDNENNEFLNRTGYINMNGGESLSRESFDSAPEEYENHLYRLSAMISHEDKLRIRKLIEKGAKIKAIQECREATGAGLKDAKDIVDDYMTYLG